MMSAIGYIGAALLALCGVPLLFSTRWGDRLFLWAWFGGEVCCLIYVLGQPTILTPLALNYAANVALVAVVLWRRRANRPALRAGK